MNALERGLSRPIPFEKAASYFVGLKNFAGAVDRRDAELLEACVKQAEQPVQREPLAEEAPADVAQKDPHPFLNVKSASLRFRLLAAQMKTAAEETTPSAESSAASLSSPTPAAAPGKSDYLANEEAGRKAETAAALEYYRQRLEEARAEAAQATEQNAQLQQQVEQLSMESQSHQTQLSGAQQEGHLAQQAALQQVETANQAAVQAMQQAVQASNQALQAKGQEAAAKIEVQGVRSQLFDMASQGIPGTEPALGGAGGAAEGMQPLAAGPAGEPGAEGVPAEGGEEAAAEDPAAAAAAGGEGEGGEATPDSGMNQAGESASAAGMPGSQGETAPAAEATPDAVPPQGDGSGDTGGSQGGESSPPQARSDGSSGTSPDAKRQGQISIKVGSVAARRAALEARVPELVKKAMDPRLIGALAGGAIGAGGTALEAHGHGADLGKIREDISARESAPKRGGLRGFGEALALVEQKARLGLGEATQAHPIPATIVGGLSGAAMGAAAAPGIAGLLREGAALHRG